MRVSILWFLEGQIFMCGSATLTRHFVCDVIVAPRFITNGIEKVIE